MPYRIDTKVAGGDALPTAYIESISLNTGGLTEARPNSSRKGKTGEGLSITVDLALKDVVEKNQISTWLFDSEFTKYLSVKVIQSTSAALSRQLKKGKLRALKQNNFKQSYQERTLQIQKTNSAGESLEFNLDQYSSVVTTTGERIYNIPLTTSFTLPRSNPKHLSYFTYVYLDLEGLAADYGMPAEFLALKVARGQMMAEKVITKGEVNTVSYLYFLTTTGALYLGPKHQDSTGQWYTQKRRNNRSILLRRTETLNSKVKDYREINNLSRQDLLLQRTLKRFERAQKNKLDGSPVNITELREAYISDALITQTPSQTADILFHFDIKQMIRDNASFGGILDVVKSPKVKNEIYLLSKINLLKITRRRVESVLMTNKVGSPIKSNVFDASSEVVETIIFSSDEDGILKKINTPEAGIREIDNIAFSQGVRTFAVSDRSTTSLTDGYYQYGVYVEIEDGTTKYLNKSLRKLKNARTLMQNYEIDCLNPRYVTPQGKFKDALHQKYKNLSKDNNKIAPWSRSIAAFVSVYSSLVDLPGSPAKLSKKLYSLVNAKSGSTKGVSAFIYMLCELINKLEYLLGNKIETGLLNPNNQRSSGNGNNSSGFLFTEATFSELYDSNAYRNLGIEYFNVPNKNAVGIKGIVVDDLEQRATAEAEIYWKNTNLIQVSKQLAEEYAVRPFYNRSFSTLFDLSQNQYTYFTPAAIRCGGITIDRLNLGVNLWNPGTYNAVMGATLALNTGQFNLTQTVGDRNRASWEMQTDLSDPTSFKASKTVSPGALESVYDASAANILAQSNIIVEDITIPEDLGSTTLAANAIFGVQPAGSNSPIEVTATAASTENEIAQGLLEKDNATRENMRVIANVVINQDATTGKTNRNNRRKAGKQSVSGGPPQQDNYDLESNRCILKSSQRRTARTIKSIPNQIRSLFFSESSVVRNDFLNTEQDFFQTPETTQMMRTNFDMFGVIEVFMGFDKGTDGSNVINKPKFKRFEPAMLRRAKRKILICRIKPYENLKLKIGMNKGLQLPIYDEYFLLTANGLLMNKNIKKIISNRIRIARNNMVIDEPEEIIPIPTEPEPISEPKSPPLLETPASPLPPSSQPEIKEEVDVCAQLDTELRLLTENLNNLLQYRDMLQEQMEFTDVSGMLADTETDIVEAQKKIDIKSKELKVCKGEAVSCKWLSDHIQTTERSLIDLMQHRDVLLDQMTYTDVSGMLADNQEQIDLLEAQVELFEAAQDTCDPSQDESGPNTDDTEEGQEEGILGELDAEDIKDDIPPATEKGPNDATQTALQGQQGTPYPAATEESEQVNEDAEDKGSGTLTLENEDKRSTVVNFDDEDGTETEEEILDGFENKQQGTQPGMQGGASWPPNPGGTPLPDDGSTDTGIGYQFE